MHPETHACIYADGEYDGWETDRGKELRANAERIVACVNACAGIEDPAEHLRSLSEQVERHKRWHQKPSHGPCCTCQECGLDYDTCRCDLDEVADENTALRAQRDELLAALVDIRKRSEIDSRSCLMVAVSSDDDCDELLERLDSIISKAKGESHE